MAKWLLILKQFQQEIVSCYLQYVHCTNFEELISKKKRKKGTQREDDESRFIININEMRCEKDMSSNDKS